MKFCDACGHGNPADAGACGRCGAEFGAGGEAEGGLGPGSFVGGDRFEILAHLGKGGMGSVYKAQNPRLGKEVAIKLLNQDRLSDHTTVARFQQEARAVAALRHPNTIRLIDFGHAAERRPVVESVQVGFARSHDPIQHFGPGYTR